MDESACLAVKNIGKPYTGKPYVRFDEGGLVKDSMDWLLRHRQTKGAETDRPIPTDTGACPLLYPELRLLYLQLCCQMIVLSDSLWCSEPFWSTCQSRTRPYPITLLPVCKHPTRKLVSSQPNFYFPISNFKPLTATRNVMFIVQVLCSSPAIFHEEH